jgi:HEAT repeat protein
MGAMATLFNRVVNQFKRLASGLKETPKVAVDDFELEHFLIYHGLIGTSPENQRDFRDVRADIKEALDTNSALQLSIALKIPPLWWSEKLAAIVLELTNVEGARQNLIDLLLPSDEENPDPNIVPICNSDWRVRANAASILADLNCKQASHHLTKLLDDTTYDGKISFAHVSYALGRLGTDQAKEALLPYLYDEEPWLRVDAARALSLWPSAIISHSLADALLAKHPLQDYMCIAIAKQHKISELLKSNDPIIHQAALEMIIQVIDATSQTFNNDIAFDLSLPDCFAELSEMTKPAPRQIRATLMLANWLKKNQEQLVETNLDTRIQSILDSFANKSTAEAIVAHLSNDSKTTAKTTNDSLGQMRHAAYLAGKLGIVEASESLEKVLDNGSPIINEAIDALSLLKDKQAVPRLIALLNKSVNLEERTTQPLSAQPVAEENPHALTYWITLRALGTLPTKESYEVLFKASRDFAPDKRQMALESLLSVIVSEPGLADNNACAHLIDVATNDPSVNVRVVAYKAVGQLGFANLIGKTITALCQSKDPSVKRQAKASLLQLAAKGHGQAVCNALTQKLKTEFDPYRRQDLEKLLSSAR